MHGVNTPQTRLRMVLMHSNYERSEKPVEKKRRHFYFLFGWLKQLHRDRPLMHSVESIETQQSERTSLKWFMLTHFLSSDSNNRFWCDQFEKWSDSFELIHRMKWPWGQKGVKNSGIWGESHESLPMKEASFRLCRQAALVCAHRTCEKSGENVMSTAWVRRWHAVSMHAYSVRWMFLFWFNTHTHTPSTRIKWAAFSQKDTALHVRLSSQPNAKNADAWHDTTQ